MGGTRGSQPDHGGAPGAAGDVSGSLVASKLSQPPARPELIPRTQLVAQLNEKQQKLCLVSAPAGWGKSSLLASWLNDAPDPDRFSFLRLEESDDDAAVFWSYAIAALQTLYPDLQVDSEEALQTPGVDPMRRVVPQLVNELARAEGESVLVLDDYHHVTDPAIHRSVLYLLDHLPPVLRVVIATRSDPPLQLGRLRASGEMLEMRAAQLALTTEEAHRLLQVRFDLDLDAADIELLCRRTEGWPAALQLAGLSLQRDPDHTGFVRSFAGDDRSVADYLTGEVLGHLPAERREFLLRTSVLDRLTGPLCDAVAGVEGSAVALDELEKSNLFVIPLDNRRVWYRYHALFADWLRHELQRTEPSRVAELHSRASRWYAQNDSLEPAVTHAMAARDHRGAADLIDEYLWPPTRIVNWSALSRWLEAMPDEIAADHTPLATAHTWLAMARGDFDRATQWSEVAESALGAAPPEARPQLETVVSLFQALCQAAGGERKAARATFEAVAGQEQAAGSAVHAMAIGLVGMTTFWDEGALAAIPALLEGSVERDRLSLSDGGVTAFLAAAYAEIGDWSAARDAADKALTMAGYEDEEYRHPDLMAAHYALGKVLAAGGEREKAREETLRGLDMARAWVDPLSIAYGCLALAEISGDLLERRALVREARQLTDSSDDPGRMPELVSAAERRLALRASSQSTAGTIHVEPLTDRETDVLRLLRSSLSLREIAGELYISYNTAKGYAKSIYRKLGVTSRAAAVDTARDLDLL